MRISRVRLAPAPIRAWSSSTTCPAGTDRPRRSPGDSPTTATWRFLPISISVRGRGRRRRTAPASARPEACRTMGDVQGAVDYLRTLPYLSGKVGIIGYCSGGRQAYLAACTLRGIDAAIDCYGGGVVAKSEELTPRQPVAPIEFTRDLQCPLLGLFGVEDSRPSPEDVAKTEEALKKFGKTYEFHTYEDAGHAFFAVDRPQYRVHAAVAGWKKVFAWFEKHLQ